MLKGRIGLWVVMLVVTMLVSWLIPIVPGWFESKALHVNIDVSTDDDFAQVLANQKVNKIVPTLTSDNPTVIITDKEEKIEGYTKYDNYLFSPIVAWACGVYQNETGFIKVPQVSNTFKLDLYTVLCAIEDGKKWEDFGFHKSVINGPVTLYLPATHCSYYNSVVELFLLTLNDGKIPTETEREALMPRVSEIIAKCHHVPDIAQAIKDEYDHPSDTHKIFIGPEYLYQRSNGSSIGYGSEYAKQYRPVYFFDTVIIEADVFVKDESEQVELANKFISNMKTEKAFIDQTGWRVKNIEFDIWSISYIYYKNP